MQVLFSNGLNKMKEEYKQPLENCQAEFTPACSVVSRTLSTLEVKSPALEKVINKKCVLKRRFLVEFAERVR
jgi:hypothetical protein